MVMVFWNHQLIDMEKQLLCMRNAKRLFKCAAYMVYFVGVLVFAVASKGSFLLMTQSLGNRLQV